MKDLKGSIVTRGRLNLIKLPKLDPVLIRRSQYQQFCLNEGKCPRNLQLSTEQIQSDKSQYEKEVEEPGL
jgi:hypothetical protein